MDSIIQTYQSLARGNYAMLDNLKLGYGGTKEELKRLLKDAGKLTGKKFDVSNFSDVVEAIHAVQENMGITGTTAKEASSTISGSLASMKASWQNLLPALIQGGDAFDQCVDNLIDSAKTFFKNIKPAIIKALSGIGDLVTELAPIIEKEFPTFVDELLPPLLKAATALLKGLIKALPTIAKTIIKEIPDILKGVGEAITDAFGIDVSFLNKIGDFFEKNGEKIEKFTPVIVGLVGAFLLFNKLKGIGSIFSGLFGKGGSGGSSGSGGMFSGLANLAKIKTTDVLKGMANLAIIFGGFAILIPPLMLIAPSIDKLGGIGALLKVAVAIGIIGLVGGAIAKVGGMAGKISVKDVAIGLANMAIMLAGMSVIFLLVGALSLIPFDLKRVLGVVAIIGLIGIVGAAIALLAVPLGLFGVYGIAAVAIGLANMAIALTGMSVVFLLMGALSLIPFDYARMLKVVGLIGLLGTVGTLLAVFAAVSGGIPFPIILAGITNIGLVLAGLVGLIVAFGKLSEVKGIHEFLETGGDMLCELFNILGRIAGSLVGGALEGISDSLPEIGTNIGKFGKNIKPLFDVIGDADLSGLGEFLSSVGGFLLQIAGGDLLSSLADVLTFNIFDNSDPFTEIGNSLSNFAKNSQEFFNIVATLPEDGFTKATSLFESLDGLGGFLNMLTGNDFLQGMSDLLTLNFFDNEDALTTIGKKLSQFAIDSQGFFTTVATYPEEGFTKATSLFESLSGLDNLPVSGGLAGWFGGDINYTEIANGLTALGGEGVKKFFTMAGSLNPQAFENTKLLFESLSGMSESLPEEDNWWDKLWGNDKVSLGDVAADLGAFAEKSASFFTMINSLNLSKLNGLWESLKKSDGLTADISTKVGENIDDIVSKISELPKKMGEALKNGGKPLADSFVEIWTEAVKASVKPVNKLLSGANHILKEFGSKKTVIEWQPYANGTNGHKGGNALVNDGNGAELVQMPNGKAFIPNGRNVFIPNAPKGMKVLPADRTAQLMGKNSPTFNYAKGIGDIDIWSYYDNAKGLVDKITENISYKGMNEFTSNIGQSMVSTFAGEMPAWVEKLFEECGQGISSYVASKGVTQWLPTVVRALKMEGQYSLSNVARTLFQMKTESGGNPKAINLWDSNAKKGIPSKGLMQVIDPTFEAYARNGFDKNIYDPLSNILASIRYAVSRYGSLAKAYRGVGYENGGLVTQTGTIAENPNHPEWVIPTDPQKRGRALNLWTSAGEMLGISYAPEDSEAKYVTVVENNSYSPQFIINVSGSSDDRTLAKKVKKVVKEAIDEMLDEADRKNPALIEV